MGILGQKPVPGMDRVDVGNFRGADDAIDPEVAFVRGGLTDTNGLICQLDVHRVGIRLGIDRDGTHI